jgi:hypothetical protein
VRSTRDFDVLMGHVEFFHVLDPLPDAGDHRDFTIPRQSSSRMASTTPTPPAPVCPSPSPMTDGRGGGREP